MRCKVARISAVPSTAGRLAHRPNCWPKSTKVRPIPTKSCWIAPKSGWCRAASIVGSAVRKGRRCSGRASPSDNTSCQETRRRVNEKRWGKGRQPLSPSHVSVPPQHSHSVHTSVCHPPSLTFLSSMLTSARWICVPSRGHTKVSRHNSVSRPLTNAFIPPSCFYEYCTTRA